MASLGCLPKWHVDVTFTPIDPGRATRGNVYCIGSRLITKFYFEFASYAIVYTFVLIENSFLCINQY